MTRKIARNSFRPGLLTAGAWLIASLSGGLVFAQNASAEVSAPDDVSPISIELNRLETVGEACRAYLMVENRTEALESLRLDLFALDQDGVVAKRLAVQLGPVPGDKTVIKLFDFSGVTCKGVGSVLLNDVLACEDEAGPREDCLASLAVATKSVPFLR